MPRNRKDANKRRSAPTSSPGEISPSSSSTPSSPPSIPEPLLPTPSSSLGSRLSESRLIDLEDDAVLPAPQAPVEYTEIESRTDTRTREPVIPSRQSTLTSPGPTFKALATSTSELLTRSNLTMRASKASAIAVGSPSPPMLNPAEGFGSFTTSGTLNPDDVKESQHSPQDLISASPPSFPPPPSPLGPPTLKSRTASVGGGIGLSFSPPRRSALTTIPTPPLTRNQLPPPGLHVRRAKFDHILGRKVLLICYTSHPMIQIWDLAHLNSISELLNIDIPPLSPNNPWETMDLGVIGSELLAILAPQDLVLYSLASHSVVSRVSWATHEGAAVNFAGDPRKQRIALATVNPPGIRVLSIPSLELVHLVASSSLDTFDYFHHTINAIGHDRSQHSPPPPSRLSAFHYEPWDHTTAYSEPVFAMKGRLLAFAAPTHTSSHPGDSALPRKSAKLGAFLGKAVKSLTASLASSPGLESGRAEDQSATSSSPPPSRLEEKGSSIVLLDLEQDKVSEIARWSVRSSYSERLFGKGEELVQGLSGGDDPALSISTLSFSADGLTLWVGLGDGRIVRAYSIASLFSSSMPHSSSMHTLSTSQIVTSRRPSPAPQDPLPEPDEVYVITRGNTTSLLHEIQCSDDGRWLLVGSRHKGTGHVIGVNPYGGVTDVRSHVSGRVFDPEKIPETLTPLSPAARIWPAHGRRSIAINSPTTARIPPPVVYSFLPAPGSSAYERMVPSHLIPVVEPSGDNGYEQQPHGGPQSGSWSSPRSLSSGKVSMSPNKMRRASPRAATPTFRPRNYQDLLMFDPVHGSLSLQRISVDVMFTGSSTSRSNMANYVPGLPSLGIGNTAVGHLAGQLGDSIMGFISSVATSNAGQGGAQVSVSPTSAMLGALGAPATTGTSPSSWTSLSLRSAGADSSPPASFGREGFLPWTNEDMSIIGKDVGVVAEWRQLLGRGSEEIRNVVKRRQQATEKPSVKEYLPHAELSTFVPRKQHSKSIYLSHQFAFSTLSGEEDYHALIRSYRFDAIVSKGIEVRKSVIVSSSIPAASGTSLTTGGSNSPGEAIQEDIKDLMGKDEVLPMYPNGFGSRAGVSIPLGRFVKDVVETGTGGREWLGGKIKKEIRRKRLSATYPRFLSSTEPTVASDTSPGSLDEGELVTYDDDLQMDDNGEIWENGWAKEDRDAIDEMERLERFEDILQNPRAQVISHATDTRPPVRPSR